MTKSTDDGQEQRSRCQWCRRVLADQRLGRPRVFCSQACRQWAWVGRQRSAVLQLDDDELIVSKSQLDRLHDDLFVLACAVDDVERDQAGAAKGSTAADLQAMLAWLLEAARPIRDLERQRP